MPIFGWLHRIAGNFNVQMLTGRYFYLTAVTLYALAVALGLVDTASGAEAFAGLALVGGSSSSASNQTTNNTTTNTNLQGIEGAAVALSDIGGNVDIDITDGGAFDVVGRTVSDSLFEVGRANERALDAVNENSRGAFSLVRDAMFSAVDSSRDAVTSLQESSGQAQQRIMDIAADSVMYANTDASERTSKNAMYAVVVVGVVAGLLVLRGRA